MLRGKVRRGGPQRVRRALVVDIAIAAALAVVGVLETWVPFSSVQGEGSRAVTTLVVLWTCAALAARRRAPVAALGLAVGGFVVADALAAPLVLFWGEFVPYVIATYAVARYSSHRRGLVGAGLMAVLLLWFDLFVGVLSQPSEIVFHWTVMTVAWVLGRVAHDHAERADTADTRAAAAVAEERARIARELHDVVAHSVSLMVVQAGAATQVVEDDPAGARTALDAIRSTGVEALADMRRLVGLVRGDPPVEGDLFGGLAPQPGTGRLDDLVAATAGAGLHVRLEVQGGARPLPAGVDLAVYRLVQEALTNVRRHARAARADVRLRYLADAVEVEIEDDGRGPGRDLAEGNGLLGMRERVAVYDGTLAVGPAPGGGFRVRARLPAHGAAR